MLQKYVLEKIKSLYLTSSGINENGWLYIIIVCVLLCTYIYVYVCTCINKCGHPIYIVLKLVSALYLGFLSKSVFIDLVILC